MKKKLISRVLKMEQITTSEMKKMYLLFSQYFFSDIELFEKDILNKQWIILLEDGSDRSLKGFTTIAYIDVFIDNIDVRIVYSGDTIIHKNYWNTFELSKCWINTVLAHNQNIQKPLYWLLLSSGFRTYRFLPTFYKEFYPRYDKVMPKNIKTLMSEVAYHIYGNYYKPEKGIINFDRNSTPLRNGMAKVDSNRLNDPHVAFFLKNNPGYILGEELVCITEIKDCNYTKAGERMLF